MTYFLIYNRDKSEFVIVRQVQLIGCKLLAASFVGADQNALANDDMLMKGCYFTPEEITLQDFPLYISSIKWVSHEFLDIMKGQV